ncbi:hypothetical protein ONZ45_g17983 [Pleurotus djamor]|nr:hypothetical protein ONZ45_g17983 [Pleurotus djamor]
MQNSAPPTVAITQSSPLPQRQQIWWSNASFFVLVHIGAAFGVYYYPVSATPSQTLWLTFAIWQLATFGITVGYHRLWSHRSFEAGLGVRTVLAVLGTMGFQGSVKRYTDDPVHDPYSATRGMFYAHMGWIFFKPNYERMAWVDRSDLEADEVVRLQHKYYVPLALISGFILPAIIGRRWNDAVGAFVWAGLVSRLMIWHCIFLVNSLAHYDGLQPYTDEDTSRTNWWLERETTTMSWPESNIFGLNVSAHQHAFPYDYRSDPSLLAWDPSKWLIAGLHMLGFAKNTRLAKQDEIERAANLMNYLGTENISHQSMDLEPSVVWTMHDALKYGYVVDATDYAPEHPGGASILKLYAIDRERSGEATSAFNARINRHSQAARRKMLDLRVAKLIE